MFKRILLLFTLVVFTTSVMAFQCFFTLAKDNCWTNYQVTVVASDAETDDILATIQIPKGKQWNRQAFDCEPSQKIKFTATFSPTIWQGQEDMKYTGLQFWSLPDKIKGPISAWVVPICFASDFGQVPLPPTAISSCTCDFKAIPPVPPL
ncbi:hypothetical protein ACFORL_01425 [Legionella dresdenensis]|uniref:Periplasmic protein n=1 Tax=Legionella dresdenensis TaxID=450200 RepID=A0ABV8CCR2_9GAMM